MIRKILAAVDASERARSVVEAATEVGERFGAEVVLLRVVAIPPDFPPAAASARDALPAAVVHGAADALQQLAAGRPHVRAEPPMVYEGQPWRAILDKARELDADLIVVGSHGYGGWDRILGTTAGKVVNQADRSVLVVHQKPA